MKSSAALTLVGLSLIAGCAAKEYNVLFDCSDSRLVDICKCDCWDAYCLGKGTRLTMTDSTEGRNNRRYTNNALRAPQQCGENGAWVQGNEKRNSIEEYPFASTQQGGTYENSAAALRCTVTKAQKVQGGKIPKGTSVGDTINLQFSNFDKLGVDSCNPSVGVSSSCQNDGGQFYLEQGYFRLDDRGQTVSAKRSSRMYRRMANLINVANVTDAPETVVIGVRNYGRSQ